MLTIKYHPIGTAISDFDIEKEYSTLIGTYNAVDDSFVMYSTENIISRICLGVVEGDLDPEDVEIEFEGMTLHINKYGAIPGRCPSGFCDALVNIYEKILRTAMDKHKAEKRSEYAKDIGHPHGM